jgi:hypothetical protein
MLPAVHGAVLSPVSSIPALPRPLPGWDASTHGLDPHTRGAQWANEAKRGRDQAHLRLRSLSPTSTSPGSTRPSAAQQRAIFFSDKLASYVVRGMTTGNCCYLDDIVGWHIFKLIQPLLALPAGDLGWRDIKEYPDGDPEDDPKKKQVSPSQIEKAEKDFSRDMKDIPGRYTDRALSETEFGACDEAVKLLMEFLELRVTEDVGNSGANAALWSEMLSPGSWLQAFGERASKTIDLVAQAAVGSERWAGGIFARSSGPGDGLSITERGAVKYPNLDALSRLVNQNTPSDAICYIRLPHSLATKAAELAFLLLGALPEISGDTKIPETDWTETRPRVASGNLLSLLKKTTSLCMPRHRVQLQLDGFSQMQSMTLHVFLSCCPPAACWRPFRYTSVEL